MKKQAKNNNSGKRTVYIFLVMILLASFVALVYLIFILVNFNGKIIVLDDYTTEILGSILAVIGAVLGIPLGKKWWQLVYMERGHGLILKIKK